MDWNLAGNRVRYRFQVKIISCQTQIILYGRLSENILFMLQTNTLATLGSISFQNNPSVSMLNISSLLTIPNGLYINNCNLLTNIIWPSNVSSLYANSPYALDCSSNSLSSSEINEILALYVSLGNYGPSNMNISFQNPPAPPIGQGINDVNTLMSIGVNVTTD